MTKRKVITKCKRFLAFLMAILVSITIMPQTAEAYIGAIKDISTTDLAETLHSATFKYNGDTYLYIENEYIHFDICVASSDKSKVGRYCHTIPTASLPKNNGARQYTDLDKYGVQTICHTVCTKRLHAGNWSDLGNFSSFKYGSGFVNDSMDDGTTILGDKCIYVEGQVDGRLIRSYFTLVKVEYGDTGDNYLHQDALTPDTEGTNNWAVRARGTCGRSSKINYILSMDEYRPEMSDFYRMTMEYRDFPKTGHAGVDVAAPVVMAEMKGEYESWKGYPLSRVNIDAGIGFGTANGVTEVFSDSYSFAAPFVAASSSYSGTVPGHDSMYAEKVRYQDFILLALGNYEQNNMEYYWEGSGATGTDGARVNSYALWGFRRLYTNEQINATPEIQNQINDKYVKVSGKDYLYVTRKNGVTRVNVANNIQSVPGDALAYYYGDYETDKNGRYYFKNNVQLSPTMTMNWDSEDKDIQVYLKNDGTFVFPADKVTLESPSFTVYEPKTDAGTEGEAGLTFKGYDVWDAENQITQKGLVFDMNPDKNKAILSFSLPGNEVTAKRVALGKDGELVFSGRLALELFLAEMDMQRLSYGKDKKGKFGVNGIEAKGMVKAPEGELDYKIFNFGGSNIQGDISTFANNEHYSFELTISAKELFETNAELDLRRLNNGRLVPNNLSFDLSIKKDGVGLDITPSTPVVTLTGGGGGVYNIADQMNGNYLSIPPVLVKITGTGKVLKVMEGKLNLYVGPSKLSLESGDIGFKIPGRNRINIIKELSAGYNLNDAIIDYGNKKYQGYRFSGNISAGLSLIPENSADTKIKKLFVDTVTARLALGAHVTVAENQQINRAYASLGLSGGGGCSFQIPIVKYKVVSGSLDMKIAGEGDYPRNGNPLKNMEPSGGVVATGQLGSSLYGQVIYEIPDTIKVDGGFGEPDNYDWDSIGAEGEAIMASRGGMEMDGEPVILEMEDGSQMLAVFATNAYPIKAVVEEVGEAETGEEVSSEGSSVSGNSILSLSGSISDNDAQTEELQTAEDEISAENTLPYGMQITIDKSQIADGESVILMAVPKDQSEMAALMNSLELSSLNGWTKVTPAVDHVQDPDTNETLDKITNNEDMTVWDGVYEYTENADNADEFSVSKEAVYISIAKEMLPENGAFTVSATKDFTLQTRATAPITSVSGNMIGTDKVEITVENPVKDTSYSLHTYYGTEDEEGNIGQEYLVDSRTVTSSSSDTYSSMIQLPVQGAAAPTGRYHVSTILSDEYGMPIASVVSGVVDYVNDTVPPQPSQVTLEKIGNETLRGSWKKVEGGSIPVDGYRLTIYRKEGTDFVDTGRGYEFSVEDLEGYNDTVSGNAINGLSYDAATETYSIDMALTVGGEAMNEKGELVDDPNVSGLSADEEYALGVSAYTNKEVPAFTGDGEDVIAEGQGEDGSEMETILIPSCGNEIISTSSSITKYYETDFDILVNSTKLAKNPETKVYEYSGALENPSWLSLEAFTVSGNDVSSDVDVTVTYKDENGIDHTIAEDGGYYLIPDFSGSLPLDVTVYYHHDGVSDETSAHVCLDRDDAPPVIMLDQDIFYADEEGNYAVTGTSEPGSVVNVEGSSQTATVSDNGIFTIEGVLDKTVSEESGVAGNEGEQETAMDFESVTLQIYATDLSGNKSDTLTAPVSKFLRKEAATITGMPVLTTAALTYNGSEQSYAVREGQAEGGTIMYGLTAGDAAPEQNNEYTLNPTVVNAGTYTVWVKAIGDKRHTDSEAVKVGRIKVNKKTDAPNTPPKHFSVSNTVSSITNDLLKDAYPGWEWAPADLGRELISNTAIKATAIYTGEDKDNYENVAVPVNVFWADHTHEKADPVKENNVEPTCVANGSYDMVTYCSICHEEMGREQKIVQPLGHDYAISYSWSQNGKTCVGSAVCRRKSCSAATAGHLVTENATVTSVTGKDGSVTYTATFKNSLFKTQTKVISSNENVKAYGTKVTDEKLGIRLRVVSKAGEEPAVAYMGAVKATAKKATIPDTVTIDGVTYRVTSIGKNAFKGFKNLKSLTIKGKNLTVIGDGAFENCKKLTSVTLPASVTKIGRNAFKNTKVKKVTIKSRKITSIGKGAFGKTPGSCKVYLSKALKKSDRKKIESMLKKAGIKKKNIKYKKL